MKLHISYTFTISMQWFFIFNKLHEQCEGLNHTSYSLLLQKVSDFQDKHTELLLVTLNTVSIHDWMSHHTPLINTFPCTGDNPDSHLRWSFSRYKLVSTWFRSIMTLISSRVEGFLDRNVVIFLFMCPYLLRVKWRNKSSVTASPLVPFHTSRCT
jgi:hypothetical protein